MHQRSILENIFSRVSSTQDCLERLVYSSWCTNYDNIFLARKGKVRKRSSSQTVVAAQILRQYRDR